MNTHKGKITYCSRTVIRTVKMSNVLINLQNKMWQLAFGKSHFDAAVTGSTHQFGQFTC